MKLPGILYQEKYMLLKVHVEEYIKNIKNHVLLKVEQFWTVNLTYNVNVDILQWHIFHKTLMHI